MSNRIFRKGLFILILLLLAFALPGKAAGNVATIRSSAPASVPDEVLVRFTDSASQDGENAALADVSATVKETLTGIKVRVLKVPAGSVDSAVAKLNSKSAVRYAEPNFILHAEPKPPTKTPVPTPTPCITCPTPTPVPPTPTPTPMPAGVPNDPRFGDLWGLNNTGQVINTVAGTVGADIKALKAWGVTKGSTTIVVGMVDTGVDYNHPDLAANVWSNPGGINGCASGTHGFNAIIKTCDPFDDSDSGHGTHTSGTVGAVGNNSTGVVGVNWTVRVMGLKFLDSGGSGTTADAISAIDWAVNAKIAGVNVRVLSNSWGGGAFDQALLDEINRASNNGILFVASAGNDGLNNDTTPHYPSSYNTPNMVAVAATDNRDQLATFSNFGAKSVHLGAPGVDVLSTTPSNTYTFLSGTSMSAPHVSGAAALILSAPAFSNLTMSQLKTQILNTVDPISSLAGKTVTGGRLNAARAVGAVP